MNPSSGSVLKPGAFDGTEAAVTTSHVYNPTRSSSSSTARTSSSSPSTTEQVTVQILRGVAAVLAFIAAIVMGTGKDITRVAVIDPSASSTTHTLTFVQTVRARSSSSLVFFIVINVFVFVYSASSLAVSILIKRSSKNNINLALISIADLIFLLLLFSANGSAITTSVAIENGNIHMGWIKICGAVNNFCAHVTAAIVLSVFGSIAQLAIVMLEIIGIHIRNQFT